MSAPTIGRAQVDCDVRLLYADDVLRIWNKEQADRGRPQIKIGTVHRNIAFSWPSPPGRPANRYEDRPMPLPEYPHPDRPRRGQHPFWRPAPGETTAGLEQRLRDWWNHGRVGRGRAGSTVPFARRHRTCGCGATVPPGASCSRCRYGLTPGELLVFFELTGGWTNRQIGERLGIATGTVRTLLKQAYGKVGASGRAELVEKMLAVPVIAADPRVQGGVRHESGSVTNTPAP